jgi:hypothetical protein
MPMISGTDVQQWFDICSMFTKFLNDCWVTSAAISPGINGNEIKVIRVQIIFAEIPSLKAL